MAKAFSQKNELHYVFIYSFFFSHLVVVMKKTKQIILEIHRNPKGNPEWHK